MNKPALGLGILLLIAGSLGLIILSVFYPQHSDLLATVYYASIVSASVGIVLAASGAAFGRKSTPPPSKS